jgi:enoyl-CoA hydratase/carnithine racemase
MFLPNEIGLEIEGHVAVVELRRPPYNYFDAGLLEGLADVLDRLDADPTVRSIVLCAQGKAFCAGADFSRQSTEESELRRVYGAAVRLFGTDKPIVGAIHGAAVGGGLGLAMVADFRVVADNVRFSANFAKIGIHPGFGTSLLLPRLVGTQNAAGLFYTGRNVDSAEALKIGLADRIVSLAELRKEAMALASEIASAAPLAVVSIRQTLREGLVEGVTAQLEREIQEQLRLFASEDFREGVCAVAERRPAQFSGA